MCTGCGGFEKPAQRRPQEQPRANRYEPVQPVAAPAHHNSVQLIRNKNKERVSEEARRQQFHQNKFNGGG